MDTDLWEIQAKAEDTTVTNNSSPADNTKPDATALMLQSLLEERFQLKLHHEMRDFGAYILSVGKGGSRLKLSEDQGDAEKLRRTEMRRTNDGITGNAVPLSFLTEFLSSQVGRPVIDKTGLEGMYDFKLHWVPPPPSSRGPLAGPYVSPTASDPGSSMLSAIQELGLKLDSAKAPLEVFVIDSVQKPSEN